MTEGGAPVPRAVPQSARAGLVAFGAALFTPTVFFITAANNIVLGNLLDLPYSLGTVARFLAAFALTGALAAPVFLRADRVRACAGLMRATLFAGVAVLVSSLLTALHGDAARPLALVAVLDVAALGLVAWLLLRADVPALTQIFAGVGAVLLVAGVVQHVGTLAGERRQAHARASAAAAVVSAAATQAPAAGNVYHIILDAFQTEAYQVLAAGEPAFQFAGFTQYPEFTAHYARTNHSVPNALSGRFYRDGESMWAWREEAFSGGLWAALAETGVALHLYPHYPPYCTPLAATCQDTISYAEAQQPTTATASARNVTIDLWFLSLLPPSLHMAINAPFTVDPALPQGGDEQYGFSITTVLDLVPDTAAPSTAAAPDFTHAGAYSVQNFDRMLADEAARPPRGQYVFFHAIVPHWPFVVDDGCAYIGASTAPPYEAYMAQSVCALRLVERLLARLRELDRLEDALVIVHADHGGKGGALMLQAAPAAWPGPTYPGPLAWRDGDRIESRTWEHHLVDVYRRALLLVKFPGAAAFGTSDLPVQTIDLAPTIARHFNADADRFPGIPIRELPDAAERELVFFASSAIPNAHVPRVFSEFVLVDGAWSPRGEIRAER